MKKPWRLKVPIGIQILILLVALAFVLTLYSTLYSTLIHGALQGECVLPAGAQIYTSAGGVMKPRGLADGRSVG
jgi:hypothetical protein